MTGAICLGTTWDCTNWWAFDWNGISIIQFIFLHQFAFVLWTQESLRWRRLERSWDFSLSRLESKKWKMIASRENRPLCEALLWHFVRLLFFCLVEKVIFPNDPNDVFRSREEDSRWFWSRSRRTGKMKLSPGTVTLYYITGTITSIHSCPHPST